MGDAVIDSVADNLEREIAELCADEGIVGASVGIVRDRELVWSRGFGYADLDSKRRPDEHTVFRIASITKTFTATALFQLRDQGRLGLDDPLVEHVPEFSSATARKGSVADVTLRRLLCHHSGLMTEVPIEEPYWETLRNPTIEQIVGALPQAEVVVEPDSTFKYSNLGFALLGEVVTRVSGLPYAQYVETEILRPLGMASSAFELSDNLRARLATGYEPGRNGEDPKRAPHPHTRGLAPGGQLYSTVADLAKWLALQFRTDGARRGGTQVLTGGSLREMRRPQFLEPGWTTGYCLPWIASRRAEHVLFGHTGYLFGFRADVAFNPESRLGVAVLTNTTNLPPIRQKVFELALGADEARPPTGARLSAAEPPESWRDLVGLYNSSLGLTMLVDYRDSGLAVSIASGSSLGFAPGRLDATDRDDVFIAGEGRWTGEAVRFGRSADGSVTGFEVGPFRFDRLVEAE